RRVGDRRAEADARREAARRVLVRAHDAWREAHEAGLRSVEADQLLARARVAGRALEEWQDSDGLARLEDLAMLTEELSGQAAEKAAALPALADRLRRRERSLRTRIEAVR